MILKIIVQIDCQSFGMYNSQTIIFSIETIWPFEPTPVWPFELCLSCFLLLKLESLEISGNLLEWMRSFLIKRSKRVVVNGFYSDWIPVISGVPQGTGVCFGPSVVLCYEDELMAIPQVCKLKLFADNILLYVCVKSANDCQLLQAIVQWSKPWQFNLNPQSVRPCLLPTRGSQLFYWRSTSPMDQFCEVSGDSYK